MNYEVSNWARPGHESRHNLLYWRQPTTRLRLCGALARVGRRWWNVRTPDRYIELVDRDEPTEAAGETLDAETRRIEGLQLALRIRDGVPDDALDGSELDGLIERVGRSLGTRPARVGCSPTGSLRLR